MEIIIVLLYTLPLFFIFLYSCVQLQLATAFWWRRRKLKNETLTNDDFFYVLVHTNKPTILQYLFKLSITNI